MPREKADGADAGWSGYAQEKVAFTLDVAITPAVKRAYALGAGDISFKLQDGSTIVRTLAAKGELVGYAITMINTAGTTATGIELFR